MQDVSRPSVCPSVGRDSWVFDRERGRQTTVDSGVIENGNCQWFRWLFFRYILIEDEDEASIII